MPGWRSWGSSEGCALTKLGLIPSFPAGLLLSPAWEILLELTFPNKAPLLGRAQAFISPPCYSRFLLMPPPGALRGAAVGLCLEGD